MDNPEILNEQDHLATSSNTLPSTHVVKKDRTRKVFVLLATALVIVTLITVVLAYSLINSNSANNVQPTASAQATPESIPATTQANATLAPATTPVASATTKAFKQSLAVSPGSDPALILTGLLPYCSNCADSSSGIATSDGYSLTFKNSTIDLAASIAPDATASYAYTDYVAMSNPSIPNLGRTTSGDVEVPTGTYFYVDDVASDCSSYGFQASKEVTIESPCGYGYVTNGGKTLLLLTCKGDLATCDKVISTFAITQ